MNLLILIVIFVGLIIGYITTSGSKSQNIRLLDIFIIGPLMIYLGCYIYINKNKNINKNDYIKIISIILIFFGSSTITYNLKNYIKINK